jgi:hypothetical protein
LNSGSVVKRIRPDSFRVFLSKSRGDYNEDLNLSGEYDLVSEIPESVPSSTFSEGSPNPFAAVSRAEDPLPSENPISYRNSPKFYRGISNLADPKLAFPGSIIGSQVSL